MLFEWDEDKRLLNLRKHGIDFIDAQAVFEGQCLYTYPSPRNDEVRWVTVGTVHRRLIAVIWTERGDCIRLISARRARNAEIRHHQTLFG
jgi:uncharacterized DUF497 family protein